MNNFSSVLFDGDFGLVSLEFMSWKSHIDKYILIFERDVRCFLSRKWNVPGNFAK